MRLFELLAAGIWLFSPANAQTSDPDPTETPTPTPTGVDAFANVTVYQPDSPSTQVVYPRTENLPNNTVLAAWNDPGQTNGAISIYRSRDSGFSWYAFGTATSSETGRKLLQPHLLYINGTYDGNAGTVLLAVNAVDDKSTNIEIYASYDSGESFELTSQIASGGPLVNGTTAVSNPFLLYHGEAITLYYSTQTDPQHAQKIVQQTTSGDLDSWGSAIDVVALNFREDKPGMTTVTKLPNNQYLIAFEVAILNATSNTYSYPIYYKLTSSPENAGTERTRDIKVDTGAVPYGGPFVTWSPLGGSNGTIVLSDSRANSVFINQDLGEGGWNEVKTTAGRASAREVRVPNNDQTKLRFACGAEVGQQTPSQILVTMMDFQKALGLTPPA